MRLIGWILGMVLSLLSLAVIAHSIISLLRIPANRWTELLRSVVEPILNPIRRFLAKHLPREWQAVDLSGLAALLLIHVARMLVSAIFSF